jgi:hypothetical protein
MGAANVQVIAAAPLPDGIGDAADWQTSHRMKYQ